MQDSQTGRILAVVIRSCRFGYAAFEVTGRLLDYGITGFHSRAEARRRVQGLLKRFHPAILSINAGGTRGPRRKWRMSSVMRMVRRESQRASVRVAVMSARDLRAFFHQHEKTNKYDVALLITSWLPEVAWKFPPRPKFYDPEPWILASFDAIILGEAYLNLTMRCGARPQFER